MRTITALAIAVAAGSAPTALAQVLYDNGPTITTPTGACIPAGSTSSQLQTVGTVTNGDLGIGHMLSSSANQRIADDFTIANPSGWTISTIDFLDYQTMAPTTASPISAINLRIWNGQPGSANATVIFGDTTTNRLVSSVFASEYRISGTCDLRRGLFRSTVTVDVSLPPGTYWVDWQAIGSPNFSGPWSPTVTIVGALSKPGSNSIQSMDPSQPWTPVVDEGPPPSTNPPIPQDLPFVIHGVVTCLANCDQSSADPILNANDFQCFLNKFASADPSANCDGSTSPPVLNANDFQCFLNLFAAGCS